MAVSIESLLAAIKESGHNYDTAKIEKAYELANAAHDGQKRRSGEAYIQHPLEVANLLVELGMDTDSVVAGILHDVAEDTETTVEEISAAFGEEVAALVDGVTKLGKIPFSTAAEQQADNLRKMFLAMSHDIRVMIIKLCDRLHNMRTLGAMPEQHQRDKSLECMEVYAPIAHRLGINTVKDELQDLALEYLDPIGLEEIRQHLQGDAQAGDYLQAIVENISSKLKEYGVTGATIESRIKSNYGIYRKVFVQGRDMEEIYDIYAVRIIVDTPAECYNALGVIHEIYHPIPSRFKDYISTPKSNMYQSLHTTVLGQGGGMPFEVQIRTWEMNQTAELGIAAHWKYKEGVSGSDKLEKRIAWVRQLLDAQQDGGDPEDFLSDIKSELMPEDVYAFTPKGDVINLPAGATVIDFAYAIHSAVGNRMQGAKVNGRIVPIDHKVITGEIIEILMGPKDKGPSRDWQKIVTTTGARSKIRSWFKKERREENIAEGRAGVEKEMRRNLINVPDAELEEFMNEIARRQHMNSAEELYAAIGYGGVQLSKVVTKIRDEHARIMKAQEQTTIQPIVNIRKPKSSEGVIVEGLDNCLVKFSKCCNPLPGDEIIGFITRGAGVSIHKRGCPNVRTSTGEPENDARWVNAYWDDGVTESFKSTLEVIALDKASVFADVSTAINNMRVPIYALNARIVDSNMVMVITVGINNTEHLASVISRLKKVRDVISVERD